MKTRTILRIVTAVILSLTLFALTGGAIVGAVTKTDTLYERFKNPEDRDKPAPLWFWNRQVEDMTEEQVRELVRESYVQSGYSGFGILPEWQTSYMSDEYFALYEAALDEGSKLGMKFSLYDENGFPSYNAGGLLEEQYPDLTTKRLDMIEKTAKDGATVTLDLPEGKLMGAVAMNTDTFERIDISDNAVFAEPPPFDPNSIPVGITASTTYKVEPGYEADKAVDGSFNTRWNGESHSGGKQTLTIKFENPVTFDTVKAFEPTDKSLQRTTRYGVEYWDEAESAWTKVANGKRITDVGVSHTFEPVTAQIVRLFIDKIEADSATITEFQVWNGTTQLAVPPTQAIDPGDETGYSSSSHYRNLPAYDAAKAFDGDLDTRWNAEDATPAPHWLQISFDDARTIDSVKLYENLGRITEFQIQYWDGIAWESCYDGTTIGGEKTGVSFDFAPVNTTAIRLYITKQNDFNPTLWEMECYNGNVLQTVDGSGTPAPKGSYLEYTVPAGNWKVMAFMCVVDGNDGMDYLNAESVKAFIDITYEAYYTHFKKYFDNGTITTAFYDEPSFWPAGGRTPYGAQGARFWTMNFNEDFEEYYDESPALDYPALFMDMGEATEQARDRFQYVRTELFANNYIGQLSKWCDDHGIELTGHMLLEEVVNPVGLHGDLMKVFKNQPIPGVDVINGYGYTQEAYKIISSSANNWDKGVVMSESFGVFHDQTMDSIYKSTMDQFTKGVNLIIPHAVWYDDNPQYVTYVPELSYRSPLFGPHLPAFNNFAARAQTLLQNGRHVADIAMLYPIDTLESEFIFNGTYNNPTYADYMQVSETLSLSARRDFTYLHPEILDDRVSVDGTSLKLNNTNNYEEYKVMIMPGQKVISLSNLQKIKAFYDAGGKVIATTKLPYLATKTADNAAVKAIITEMFGVDPETTLPADGNIYRASSEYSANYGAPAAFDGVAAENSRWNAATSANQWLEVEFLEPATVDKVVIKERYDRVSSYRVEYFDSVSGTYKSVASGTTIGTNKEHNFAPVTTSKMRLYIPSVARETPSIDEFEVYLGDVNVALDTSDVRITNTNTAGGKAYFIDRNLQRNLEKALDNALAVYDVEIAPVQALSNGYLSYIHKVKEDRNIYYFANSSSDAVNTTVQIKGKLENPKLWSPYTGDEVSAEYTYKTVDGVEVTEVKLELSRINSIFLVESAEEEIEPPLRGDLDENGTVNLADIVMMRNWIMEGLPNADRIAKGDLDGNGSINLADIVALRNIIMGV